MKGQTLKAYVTLGCVSLMFFMVTAMTFSALGPALSAMMGELKWNGSEAGTGFSLLGVFCGITSTIPALLIRRIGVRATLVTGSLVMALAFVCLARTQDVELYFAGCSLAGLGFTLLATVRVLICWRGCLPGRPLLLGFISPLAGLAGWRGRCSICWSSASPAIGAISGWWRARRWP